MGNRINLFHLMKNLHLDELAVGGGAGTVMLRRTRRLRFGLARPVIE
jgi:hypothetical protein